MLQEEQLISQQRSAALIMSIRRQHTNGNESGTRSKAVGPSENLRSGAHNERHWEFYYGTFCAGIADLRLTKSL